FLHRVEAIDRTGLSAGKRVDLGNLRNVFRIWIFESEEIGTWQSMPRGAQTVGDALFPLFMRSFAPLPRRLDSITGRLERSPGFLEETKGRIRAPIKIWCEISLEAAQRVPGFLHVIEATGKEALAGPDRARLEEGLAYTAKAMSDSKAFIRQQALATIPPNEELTVIETPSYLRHVIPFAAYNAPARFEAHKQGFYMVTPVEDKPEMLREHSFPGVRNTAVHEGYPGHHLQLTCASLN